MENQGGLDEQKAPEIKLDPKHVQGFVRFFKRLPEDGRCIRFFNRKEFYTAHGDNAIFVAKNYYRTMTAVRNLGSGSESLPSVSISSRLFETILRDLLLERSDHTVELYDGSGANFQISKTGSPGKLGDFEDILFSNNDMQEVPIISSVFVTVKENERFVGLAYVDPTKRSLGVSHFLDDDSFTNLESILVGLGSRECLFPSDIGSFSSQIHKKVEEVVERCDCLLTRRKKSEFVKDQSVRQDLSKLLKDSVSVPPEMDLPAASSAMAALLSYTEILADDSGYGRYDFVSYGLESYMRLDASALRALNVLAGKNDANKNFSLAGLMDRTCTSGMGKRLLKRWLKQPLISEEEITCRLDAVETFVEDFELRQSLRQHLKRIPDIERLVGKLGRKRASLKDVVKLYQASVRLPFIRDALKSYNGQHSTFLEERYVLSLSEWSSADHLGKYDGLVEAAIDLERLEEGEYLISPGYDEALGEIRGEIDSTEDEIKAVHEEVARDLGLSAEKTLKMDKNTQYGYVFRISKKEETAVRKRLGSMYLTLETRKDGVKFTNGKLRRLSDLHCQLSENYGQVQKDLVAKVVEVASTFVEVFEGVASLLAELDVLLSFADLAVSAPIPYVRPKITSSNEGDIILEGCRHPCVEVQDDISFIPNDCKMVRGESWFQIITGPNMGGKSTFIRQVGVVVLMAQVGCFVPCSRAEISIRDCIFARVGAGDCQLKGVSTFMAEMLETASILKASSEKSLIIIDELGRGTSTYDGFGLAWAICEHLVEEIKAPTLFATHFHELTLLANQENEQTNDKPSVGVANFHVSAHIEPETQKLTMLYKVEEGPCDQSFGIHVAEFAHFPEEVVEMAKKKAAELEDFSPAVGEKRKREVESADGAEIGASRVRQFLRDFGSLPIDEMNPSEALEKIADLTKSLEEEATHNDWLRNLISS